MDNQNQITEKNKKLRIAIIVLVVLLVLSLAGLLARYIQVHYFTHPQTTVEVPDNIIEKDEPNLSDDVQEQPLATALELYKGNPADNDKFEVKNMFPGDCITKYFCVKATHEEDIVIFFKTTVTKQTKYLDDVLNIKVTDLDTGKVLCNDKFSEINNKKFYESISANEDKTTTSYYQIDVSLDTSVGNEYQAAMLTADFEWGAQDKGDLDSPGTGFEANVLLWIILAVSSLSLVVLLILKNKKEAEQYGKAK